MHIASKTEQIKSRQFAQASAVAVALSFVLTNSRVFLALNESEANAENTYVIEGLVRGAPKAASETWAVGDALYWDNTAKKFTKTSTDNTLAGYAGAAAGSADTTGTVDFFTYA